MPRHSHGPRIIGTYRGRTRRLWLVRREPLAYAWSAKSERREKLARSAVGRVLHVLYRVLHPRPIFRRWLGGHPKLNRLWSRLLRTIAFVYVAWRYRPPLRSSVLSIAAHVRRIFGLQSPILKQRH